MDRSFNKGLSKGATLKELLVQKIVCVQEDRLAANENDLSKFSEIVVLELSNKPQGGLNVVLQGT